MKSGLKVGESDSRVMFSLAIAWFVKIWYDFKAS